MIKPKHILFKYLSAYLLDEKISKLTSVNNIQPKTALIVQSFKGYERFWEGCFASLHKYLPRSIPIYFLSDHEAPLNAKKYELYSEIILPVNTGKGTFAKRGLIGLLKLPPSIKYIIYMQEDMWISNDIDSGFVQEIVNGMIDLKLKLVKICEGSFHPDDYDQVVNHNNKVPLGAKISGYRFHAARYIMSHHVSIFERKFLTKAFALGALAKRDRPFDHEIFISNMLAERALREPHSLDHFPIVLLDRIFLVNYAHASQAGLLTESGRQWLIDHNLSDQGHINHRISQAIQPK